MDSSIDDSEIFPYFSSINIAQNDRNLRGDGVVFLLSSRVKLVLRPDLCEGNVESIWIEIFPRTNIKVHVVFMVSIVLHPSFAF